MILPVQYVGQYDEQYDEQYNGQLVLPVQYVGQYDEQCDGQYGIARSVLCWWNKVYVFTGIITVALVLCCPCNMPWHLVALRNVEIILLLVLRVALSPGLKSWLLPRTTPRTVAYTVYFENGLRDVIWDPELVPCRSVCATASLLRKSQFMGGSRFYHLWASCGVTFFARFCVFLFSSVVFYFFFNTLIPFFLYPCNFPPSSSCQPLPGRYLQTSNIKGCCTNTSNNAWGSWVLARGSNIWPDGSSGGGKNITLQYTVDIIHTGF